MQPLNAFAFRRDFLQSRVSPAIYSSISHFHQVVEVKFKPKTPKMSSPSHRRQRSSQSGTPKRTSRKSSQPVASIPSMDPSAAQLLGEAASSQAGSQGTPRNAPLSSSPMFFRSSPANSAPTGRNADVSSPLRQVTNDLAMTDGGDCTPRPSGQFIGGMSTFTSVNECILIPYRFFANSLCLELKPWSRASRSPANRPP
jgi:hypothetical protein